MDDLEKIRSPRRSRTFGLIVVILLIWSMMTAAGAYLLRDMIATENEKTQNSDIEALREEVRTLNAMLIKEKANNSNDESSSICVDILPSDSAIENIKASITIGNTAVLEGYMSDSVNVILAASEGIGKVNPSVAVSSITDFVSDSINTWNFELSTSEIESYANGDYGQYFPAVSVIGKSTNNKVISFSFCGDKINTVFFSNSLELLTY